MTLFLLALPLFVTFSTINAARWMPGLPSLPLVAVLSLAVGQFLARQAPWNISHPVAIASGLAVAFGMAQWLLPSSPVMGMGVFLIAMTWWTAYATLWLARHGSFPPLVAFPGLAVLLVVLAFLPSSYAIRLPLYLLAATPAMAHLHAQRWRADGQRGPGAVPIATGVALVAMAVLPAWLAPTSAVPSRPTVLNRLEEPWYTVQEWASTLFAEVPNRRELPSFGLVPDLPFTGAIDPGEDILMVVKSPRPFRWRVRVYEEYTPQGWVSSGEARSAQPASVLPQSDGATPARRREVTIQVRPTSRMDAIATAGEPVRIDSSTPGLVELSPEPIFTLDLDSPQVTYLPPDVDEVREALLSDEPMDKDERLDRVLASAGLRVVTGADLLEKRSLTVERVEGDLAVPMALTFAEELVPQPRYETVGSIPVVSAEMLRVAGQEYPTWVTDRYLQLPPQFPQSVRILARDLVEGKDNPFDVAEWLETYLRSLYYSPQITAPPPGHDGVEHFLMFQRVGYCTYFASAMVTMLRSLGIPARLVVGFAPGSWDSQREAWVVQAKHYHAWPEVYFPGYGWVEFEPTPSGVQPSLENLRLSLEEGEPVPEDPIIERREVSPLDPLREDCPEPSDGPCGDPQYAELAAAEEPLAGEGGGGTGRTSLASDWGRVLGLLWLPSLPWLALVITLGASFYLHSVGARLGLPVMTYASTSLLARLAGAPRRPHDTPLEYGASLATLLPAQAGAIEQITMAYVLCRYGRDKKLDGDQSERLRASWITLRGALLRLLLRRVYHQRHRQSQRGVDERRQTAK